MTLCLYSGPSLAQISVTILSVLINNLLPKPPRIFSTNRPGLIFSPNLCSHHWLELVIRRHASGQINAAHWSILPGGGERHYSNWIDQKLTSVAYDTQGRVCLCLCSLVHSLVHYNGFKELLKAVLSKFYTLDFKLNLLQWLLIYFNNFEVFIANVLANPMST